MIEASKVVSHAKNGTGMDNRERWYSLESFSYGNCDNL
jgi:hypothetical protein